MMNFDDYTKQRLDEIDELIDKCFESARITFDIDCDDYSTDYPTVKFSHEMEIFGRFLEIETSKKVEIYKSLNGVDSDKLKKFNDALYEKEEYYTKHKFRKYDQMIQEYKESIKNNV